MLFAEIDIKYWVTPNICNDTVLSIIYKLFTLLSALNMTNKFGPLETFSHLKIFSNKTII